MDPQVVQSLPADDFQAKPWLSRGLISRLTAIGADLFSTRQIELLRLLEERARTSSTTNPHPTALFPHEGELRLGRCTVVSDGLQELSAKTGEENVLAQLLPYWVMNADESCDAHEAGAWHQEVVGSLEVSSAHAELIERVRSAQSRIDGLASSRVTQFARSASYMGSKASLAPYLVEVLRTFLAPGTVVVDLMCGSGAASWAFSRSWRTLASDAQQFSQLLSVVQGGGMTTQRAQSIADKVLSLAREHFKQMPPNVEREIEVEHQYLASELSAETLDHLSEWVVSYPRVGNPRANLQQRLFSAEVEQRRLHPKERPYLLFSAYFANLFFGVRQAAEIDSLRFAVEQLDDPLDRSWALGALVCAVSSCAYSYGGHFAQPKLDGSVRARVGPLARDMLVSRGLSVSHEFFVRLTSLGAESAHVPFAVESIDGPWENALGTAEALTKGAPVCVYLDPPYTRDEYSRYYHVLETLVRYDYPTVQDKASMPKRGEGGRFASEFGTRDIGQIEAVLTRIINECLSRGWKCLWSYSNTGVASIERVLSGVSGHAERIDFFCMDHVYKAQGKHRSKPVKEYAFLIEPK